MILECSPMSVRATKQAVMRSLDVPALEVAMHNLHYPALRRHDRQRGHGRRPEGLRREAQAELEESVTVEGQPGLNFHEPEEKACVRVSIRVG